MKYCYRCGMPYEGDECPGCHTDLFTEKPNSMTASYSKEQSDKEFEGLLQETKRL